MRRLAYRKYLLIAAVLFLLLSLPLVFVEGFRTRLVGSLAFSWRKASSLKKGENSEISRLEGENYLLRIEIGKLRTLLEQQAKLQLIGEELKRCDSFCRRYEEMHYLQGLLSQVIPARVIYRDPGSFSSSMWVGVGEETNRLLDCSIIQKNSPVIVGSSVVGAIDYVGKKQSRVRLITDMALKPAVRAVRGHPQNIALIEAIDPILRHLNARKDLPLSFEARNKLIKDLDTLKANINRDLEGWYLAKGILQGAGTPMWRSVNHTLRGIGFNYDFGDVEGPARELISGKPVDGNPSYPAMPIIQENDLLVTTGMDGIFPPGLRVAEVTKIYPLREGAYTYEIEASPVAGNLESLQTVFIIPSIGYEGEEANYALPK